MIYGLKKLLKLDDSSGQLWRRYCVSFAGVTNGNALAGDNNESKLASIPKVAWLKIAIFGKLIKKLIIYGGDEEMLEFHSGNHNICPLRKIGTAISLTSGKPRENVYLQKWNQSLT